MHDRIRQQCQAMRSRLHLRNATSFIEWEASPAGLLQAKAFRRHNADFARRRIRAIIQAFPDRIECGKVYRMEDTDRSKS
jgi:hypothetical protein